MYELRFHNAKRKMRQIIQGNAYNRFPDLPFGLADIKYYTIVKLTQSKKFKGNPVEATLVEAGRIENGKLINQLN